ncbi:MAG: HEAT repeat domain-containing protein [Anaerolineae bacterium]|nr:HEAT repeat domain-containing protein [Anaerolineae bacterium]
MPLFGPPNVERLKAKGDIKGLIKALGYEKDPLVRQAASLALVELGAAAVEPLIATLEHKDDALRQAAAETLAKLGGPAIEPLIAATQRYPVQSAAADALIKIGEPAVSLAVERLVAALVSANDDIIRKVEALVEIGTPAVDELVAILTDKSAKRMCRIGPQMLVMRRENEEVIPHLHDLAKELLVFGDSGLNLRGIAAMALGKIGDTRAVAPLINAVQDEDKFVRWTAAGALFAIGDDRALAPLVAELDDGDLVVKGHNVWVLIGDGQTLKPLMADLIAENPEARLHAAETLKRLGWGSG